MLNVVQIELLWGIAKLGVVLQSCRPSVDIVECDYIAEIGQSCTNTLLLWNKNAINVMPSLRAYITIPSIRQCVW